MMDTGSKEYKDYLVELGKIPGSRLCQIVRVVNERGSKSDAKLKTPTEERYFDNLMENAEAHLRKYGSWPIYEMPEIEYDDPVLDIYSD